MISASVKCLRDAADTIDLCGWTQGRFETNDGRVCVSRALGGDGSLPARLAFVAYLKVESMIGWNDTPGRTQEEVTGALRACADQIEATP